MEKSIHSHLFAALVSTKEQRLAFMATPEQQKFDETAAGIEKDIENPDTLTDALIPKIAQLKVSAIADKDNSNRVEQLNDILNKKMDLQREIVDTEKKTSDTNADWKKIAEDIKSTDVVKRDAAIDAGKKLIVDSRARMNELSFRILNLDDLEPRLLAKVTVKAIAAHNKNIENVQALDPDNKITFVPTPRVGEQDAIDALNEVDNWGVLFISTDLNAALTEFKNAAGPRAKEIAGEKIDDVVKARREEIYTKINEVSSANPPFVNAEKQIDMLIRQLKEMTDEVSAIRTPAAAPAAAPAATPTTAPDKINIVAKTISPKVENNKITLTVDPKDADVKVTRPDGSVKVEKAVNGVLAIDPAPNGEYKFESGTAVATAKIETKTSAPSVSPETAKQVDAVKDAIVTGDKTKIEKSLEDFNKLPSTKEKQTRVDEINKALVAAGHDKTKAILESDKIVVKDGSPKEAEKAAEPADEVKTKLQELLDFFKELITFLRGERLAGGDLGVLRSEIESIDEQIAKIKKDNPDFSKKPDIVQQITALEVKKNDLKATIDQGKNLGTQVVADARTFVRDSANAGTPLYLRVEKDKDGNVFLVGMPNAPGATPEKCKSHMQYMTDRLQKVHPELRLNQRASTDQRVYFNIYGDVNINSKNDNRRIVDNRTKVDVRGKNNTTTVGVSADGSQNGSNDSFGALGASQEGTAKNKASARPSVKAETIVPAPPVLTKPKRVVTEEIKPESGSL